MFYSMIHLRWFPSGVNNLKFHLQKSRMAPGGSQGKVTLIKAKWSPPAVKETNLYVPFHLFLLLWLCPQVVFNFLRPHELQHTPVLHYPGVCSDSCPLSWWRYLTISTSAIPFSFCLQSFPAIGSSLQVAKVLKLQVQHQSFQRIFTFIDTEE